MNTIGYIQDCGKKLDELLAARGASDETRDEIVTVVKRMILESYHNGLGQKIREEGEADLPSHKRAASLDATAGRDRAPSDCKRSNGEAPHPSAGLPS